MQLNLWYKIIRIFYTRNVSYIVYAHRFWRFAFGVAGQCLTLQCCHVVLVLTTLNMCAPQQFCLYRSRAHHTRQLSKSIVPATSVSM